MDKERVLLVIEWYEMFEVWALSPAYPGLEHKTSPMRKRYVMTDNDLWFASATRMIRSRDLLTELKHDTRLNWLREKTS